MLIRKLMLTVFCSLLLAGCSSGGGNPVVPLAGNNLPDTSYESLPVGVSDLDSGGNPFAGYGVMGLFDVSIDTEVLSGELVSMRSNSMTDVLEVVDITNFLQIAPCTDCARIGAISADIDGNIILSIGIKHPFDAGNPMDPISGKNRGDLHLFNVEGLVVADSDVTVDFAGIKEQVADFDMINADGYSPYLDDVLDAIYPTTATIHPYKLHFDDYSAGNFDAGNPMGFESVTDPPPSGNLVMAMGCDYDYQDYIFSLTPDEPIRFMFAIGCTYAVSADTKSQRFTPEYRVPQHLKKAACEVTVRILDNQFEPGDPLSTADLAIDVVDINHGVAAGDALNEMAYDSSVGGITLEIPGVLSGVTNVTLTNSGGTGHDLTDPLTYEITIQNEESAAGSGYMGLVKVLDAYPSGSNTFLPLGVADGIERVEINQNPLNGLFVIDEFATYQVFFIDASGVYNHPPVADLQPDPIIIHQGNSVNLDGTASYDTDGSIIYYEFDYEWDGIEANFTADTINGHGTVLSDPYDTVGDFTAGLRVTDNLLAVGYDSVPVTVNEPSSCPDAPFAGYTITQDFEDSGGDFFHFQMMTGWHWKAGVIFDSDFLSSGDGICIYSQEVEEDGTFGGELRYYDPRGDEGWGYTAVGPDYPGEQGVCVDVDSTDLVAFVTLGSNFYEAFGSPIEWTLDDYINESNDYFTVVDPYVGQSSEVVVNVGTRIRAIDIDGYDDIWVLDIDNVMHRYVKGTSPLSYTEDINRQFDLDIATGGLFTGQVYEFVINFHNEAFFILTDNSPECDLWRFECDGIYYPSVNGNANPMVEVLQFDCTGNADIVIDNLDASGNHLTGEQDSQIIVISGYNPDNNWHTIMSRVDSELDQNRTLNEDPNAHGIQTAYIDQRTNDLWGWCRTIMADSWEELWTAPAQWE